MAIVNIVLNRDDATTISENLRNRVSSRTWYRMPKLNQCFYLKLYNGVQFATTNEEGEFSCDCFVDLMKVPVLN